jgi:hypothetical protein
MGSVIDLNEWRNNSIRSLVCAIPGAHINQQIYVLHVQFLIAMICNIPFSYK